MVKIKQITADKVYKPKNEREARFVKAVAIVASEKEAANFLRDIMTESEIEEFSNRLEIAHLLLKGISYQKVADQVGTSTTTVTRVAQWLFRGCGGYAGVLIKAKQNF